MQKCVYCGTELPDETPWTRVLVYQSREICLMTWDGINPQPADAYVCDICKLIDHEPLEITHVSYY